MAGNVAFGVNRAIKKRVKELAKRPFQKRAGSRASVFEIVDKPALRTLPAVRYEHADFVVRRVPENYHVEYSGFYYSIPFTLYKQMVTLRVTANMVEILSGERERVALHQLRRSGSRYVTNIAHMPKNHQHQRLANQRNGEDYRSWAETVGVYTLFVIDSMLRAQHVEESAYRSCMGVLQMAAKYGATRVESACKQARTMCSPTYTTVKNLLKNTSLPMKTAKPLPLHENLRNPAEFVGGDWK